MQAPQGMLTTKMNFGGPKRRSPLKLLPAVRVDGSIGKDLEDFRATATTKANFRDKLKNQPGLLEITEYYETKEQ